MLLDKSNMKIGSFYAITYDENLTRQRIPADWESYDYGTFRGQLRAVCGDSLEFLMVHNGISWVSTVNNKTRLAAGEVVVTNISRIYIDSEDLDPDCAFGVKQFRALNTDENDIAKMVEDVLKKQGHISTTIEIKVSAAPAVKLQNAHEKFPKLVYLLKKRQHTFLYGPPGSGKSTAARLAAESMKMDYGYISLNPQTPESKIFGFIDANGVYRPTTFRKLYEKGPSKKGGVFCIDEVGNGSPALLASLNSTLENGLCAFPDKMVERHKDFVCVATDNTNGRGGNAAFPTRQPLDVAFLDRFSFMEWGYDEMMERGITSKINPKAGAWVDWVLKVRAYVKTAHPKLFVTPRASFKGAEYLADGVMTLEEIAHTVIFKGFDQSAVSSILAACPLPSVKFV